MAKQRVTGWVPAGGVPIEQEVAENSRLVADYSGELDQHEATLAALPLSDEQRKPLRAQVDGVRALLDADWPEWATVAVEILDLSARVGAGPAIHGWASCTPTPRRPA